MKAHVQEDAQGIFMRIVLNIANLGNTAAEISYFVYFVICWNLMLSKESFVI